MNMPQWLVIGVSGVTCGGKTTLSHNLREYFQMKQNQRLCPTAPYTIGDVQVISQDDYFLPVDDRRHKWIEKLNAINFELITSLDMKQMISDITWTMRGRYLVNNDKMLDNCEFIDEMNMMPPATQILANYEQYGGGGGGGGGGGAGSMPMPLMPPPTQMLNYHNSKMQQQQQQPFYYYHNHQQQQQQQLHHHHHHQQQQQQQQQLHHYQRPPPQQQHHHNHHHHPHQQQQRHSMRLVNNSAATAAHHHSNSNSNKPRCDAKINILIIDGFIIFNQAELLTLCNLKFHFHLPYEKCYERRRLRVYEPPDVTGYFEMCVWPYYERNLSEFRDRKDIIFLNGEISKERIKEFVLQKISKYVEERCDVAFIMNSVNSTSSSSSSSLSTTTLPPPPPQQQQPQPQPPSCISLQTQNSTHKTSIASAGTGTGSMPNVNHNGSSHGIVVNPCPMEQQ